MIWAPKQVNFPAFFLQLMKHILDPTDRVNDSVAVYEPTISTYFPDRSISAALAQTIGASSADIKREESKLSYN